MSEPTEEQAREHKARVRAELYARYNNRALARGEHLHGESFLRNVGLYEVLDAEWTQAWLTFVYDAMYGREVLDERTRVLVVIGECIAAGHHDHLTHHMNTAISLGVGPDELLEVCLQSAVPLGLSGLHRALAAYRAIMTDLGLASFTEPPFPREGAGTLT